jgi:hypothetical protein
MSTLSYPSVSVTETPLPALHECAQRASADYARQQKRLDALTTSFEKQKAAISPQAYAMARAEIEQQELVCDAAAAAMHAATEEHDIARAEYDRQCAERARHQRLQALDAALTAKTKEIEELQRQIGELPERLQRARGEHMRLQAEWAAIAS